MNRAVWMLLIGLFLTAPLLAQEEETPAPPIPYAGRPELFSGASGHFLVESEVQPERVALEEPCLLRVYITAVGPVLTPPERLPLSNLLLADFHVEELGLFPSLSETARVATLVGLGAANEHPLVSLAGLMPTRSWEFRYRLRPKRPAIEEVPEIAFCFHDPVLPTASRPFMTRYTDALPFEVLQPESFITPLVAPEAAFAWQSGPLLEHRPTPALPSLGWIVLLAALPIVGCVIWYAVWQRLYPDAAHQATIRRSRAARIALADLARLRRPLDRARATRAAAILTRYLHERLDLPQAEPTPAEVLAHFQRVGLPEARGGEIHQLLEQLDAHRFGTPDPTSGDLVESLRRMILTLEEEPCLAST